MTPQAIIADLLEGGIDPRLTPDGQGIVVPAGRLTPAQRATVLAHKQELIQYLIESSRLTAELLAAAMRRCDHFRDGPEARRQMRQDCLNTPYHLRQDLLDHFKGDAS